MLWWLAVISQSPIGPRTIHGGSTSAPEWFSTAAVVAGVGPADHRLMVHEPVQPVVVGVLDQEVDKAAEHQPDDAVLQWVQVDHGPAVLPRLVAYRRRQGVDPGRQHRQRQFVADRGRPGPVAVELGSGRATTPLAPDQRVLIAW